MANKQWPARGQMSEDGRYYTRFDGQVVEFSVVDCDGATQTHELEGAYVPSADQRVAEAAMRAMIYDCSQYREAAFNHGCEMCPRKATLMCHIRKYLSEVIRDPKAWEV